MADKTRILIADADAEILKSLGMSLGQEGYEVIVARDGSKALEASILKAPDLVLIDKHCPLIDASRFGSILRANPRTENTPIIVMSTDPPDDDGHAHSYLAGHLQKPFNVDEVIARVQSIAEKVETARKVKAEDRAVMGNLAQMSLVDLLQIFSMNRKTGGLVLKTARGVQGEISVLEGRLVDARIGKVAGLKALFRMIKETQGEFAFTPGKSARQTTLEGATDSLVMEGMRQEDELERLLDDLPAMDDAVERTGEKPPDEMHPKMQRVLDALTEPRQVQDLLDTLQGTDFEIAQALSHLLAARLVRKRASRTGLGAEPVLPEALVFMLRSYLHRALPNTVHMHRPRVLLVADDPRRMAKFLNGLQGIREFQKEERGAWRYGYGVMGTLPLAQDLELELVALPMRSDLLPASVPLTLGGLGFISLSSGAEDQSGLEQFRQAMIGRLGLPWLDVSVDRANADVTFEGEPRAVRGIIAAFCRALGKA